MRTCEPFFAVVPAFGDCASTVPSGSFGNFERNSLRTHYYRNVDLSLFKNVPFGGSRTLQIRVEAFNVFNIQNWGVPGGTTISNPIAAGTGQITSIVGTPRQIQLAARFVF